MNKASEGGGIPFELFQILKDDAVEVLHSYISKFGKLSSGHRTGKGQFSFRDNGDLLQKVQCMHCPLSAPDPAAGHHRPTPPPATPGHSRASLGQSLVGSLLLSPGSWSTQNSVCFLQESISQSCVSSGSWVNGDLLQESLCHTQVCCTGAAAPAAVHCRPVPPKKTLRHSSGSVSVVWVCVLCPSHV